MEAASHWDGVPVAARDVIGGYPGTTTPQEPENPREWSGIGQRWTAMNGDQSVLASPALLAIETTQSVGRIFR